jgi:ABC-2 type transport system permease protein
MFAEVFTFELRYRLTKISTYIYAVVFFALGYLVVGAASGLFSGMQVQFGMGSEKTLLNSPMINHMMISSLSLFGIFIVAAFMGNALYRDFEHKIYALFFSKPLTKFNYLMGRFAANTVVLTGIFLALALGMFAVSISPWVPKDSFGEFNFVSYILPYFVSIIPNIIFSGSIFFALVIYSRKMLPVYIGGILLFAGYIISSTLMGQLEHKTLAALLDPFGLAASAIQTEYWTIAEQNSRLIGMSGIILINRLIWIGAGILILAISYFNFSFSFFTKTRKSKKAEIAEEAPLKLSKTKIPKVQRSFGFSQSVKQMLSFTKSEISGIIKNPQFIAITLAGLIIVGVFLAQAGRIYSTPTKLVTYTVMGMITAAFRMLSLIIIVIYSGELLWREREQHINGLLDSSPVRNSVLMIPKFIAVVFVPFVLYILSAFMGIILQISKGFYDFNFQLYISEIGLGSFQIILFAALAFFIHIIVNHKYFGHLLVIGISVFVSNSASFGLEHNLLRFGKGGSYMFSDMNGFGNFLPKFLWFRSYWIFFALILLSVAFVLYVRGNEIKFKTRLKEVRSRLNKSVIIWVGVFLIGFVGTGSYIFYNTNVLEEYTTSKENIKESVRYENLYKKYAKVSQPRITDVNLEVDIFPHKQEADFRGTMVLKNKTDLPIDSLHYEINTSLVLNSIDFSAKYEEVLKDEDYGYNICRLIEPLQPGESIEMTFDFSSKRKNFDPTTSIVDNGTFINNTLFMPSLGYSGKYALQDEKLRKKHNLEPTERMADVTDEKARMNHYISGDSDWVNFQATVSTSEDQIAITPGYVQKEWNENGRNYYHCKMDHPILNFYAFVSADYEIAEDKWISAAGEEVKIEIFYDEHHPFNIDRMIRSLKKSFDYFTENFGPYQHKQVRILEFPRYASFAQSFPNTIPYSEGIGFIADVKDEDSIDYPFWVTSHELAHQWWAHQVIGGNVQGAVLMSESLCQYASLMVMEKEYGKDNIKKFLRHEMNTYLMGRAGEVKKEMPLYKVENQQYIHYNKGAVVMYALQDYIGEDAVNTALSKYVKKVKFQEPPYTNSIEFLDFIRAETPDSLQYVVTDMFEKITLFDNKTKSFEYEETEDGEYLVTLTLEAKKMYADSLGTETEVPINDWIDIGIFTEKNISGKKVVKPTYFKKHKITENEETLTILVKHKPINGGIDPYNKLIDRNPFDNVNNDNIEPSAMNMRAE